MNKLATVFIAATVALAGTCIYLANEVGVARDAADAALALARAKAASAAMPSGGSFGSAARTANGTRREELTGQARSGLPDDDADAAGTRTGDYEPLNLTLSSPAARRVAVAETRSRIKQFNADFVALQALDAETARALIDLMTQHELGAGGPEFAQPDDSQAFHEARAREFKKKVRELLGEEGAADFEAYQLTLIPRAEVDQLAGQLDALGMPLTEDQRLRLLRAVMQDRQQFKLPEIGSEQEDEYFVAYVDMVEGQSQRLAAHTRSVLNGQQLRHFEDLIERERERAVLHIDPAR